MSWVNDPYDLAQPPVLEKDIETEEPRDSKDFFWDDITYWPDTAHYHQGIHTDVCRFDDEGNHTHMAENCPHYDEYDEMGRRIVPGWTAQKH